MAMSIKDSNQMLDLERRVDSLQRDLAALRRFIRMCRCEHCKRMTVEDDNDNDNVCGVDA